MPPREQAEALQWPRRFPVAAAAVQVPVRLTFAEKQELWWHHDEDTVADLAAHFASLSAAVDRQPGAGHNISLGWAARTYHLRAFAFFEECLARRAPRARPRRPDAMTTTRPDARDTTKRARRGRRGGRAAGVGSRRTPFRSLGGAQLPALRGRPGRLGRGHLDDGHRPGLAGALPDGNSGTAPDRYCGSSSPHCCCSRCTAAGSPTVTTSGCCSPSPTWSPAPGAGTRRTRPGRLRRAVAAVSVRAGPRHRQRGRGAHPDGVRQRDGRPGRRPTPRRSAPPTSTPPCVVGPALAGLLISAVGAGTAMLLNAASYLATVTGLLADAPGNSCARHRRNAGQSGRRAAVRAWAPRLVRAAGAGRRGRPVRLQLPAHPATARQDRLPLGRDRVRAADHGVRRRFAARRVRHHRAQRPPGRQRHRPPALAFGLLETAAGWSPTYAWAAVLAAPVRLRHPLLRPGRQPPHPVGQRRGLPRPGDGALHAHPARTHPTRRPPRGLAHRPSRCALRPVRGGLASSAAALAVLLAGRTRRSLRKPPAGTGTPRARPSP